MLLATSNILLLLLAIGGALIHILLNGQYGFHRDELDIIMNARQLDWGYVAPATRDCMSAANRAIPGVRCGKT